MLSNNRAKQLEMKLRSIRNSMLKGDDAYDDKAQKVIGLIKNHLAGNWQERYTTLHGNRLERES